MRLDLVKKGEPRGFGVYYIRKKKVGDSGGYNEVIALGNDFQICLFCWLAFGYKARPLHISRSTCIINISRKKHALSLV